MSYDIYLPTVQVTVGKSKNGQAAQTKIVQLTVKRIILLL